MRVLLVSNFDQAGGAARAAYRLHSGLQGIGVFTRMLVQFKTSDSYSVIGPVSKLEKVMARARPHLDSLPVRKKKTGILFSPAWLPASGLARKINAFSPDVVHLHSFVLGMMRFEELLRIKAPIIWSLHDMWAFTGGCHYDEGCNRYIERCGFCPLLGSRSEKDLSRRVYNRKAKVFSRLENLTVVGLSRWLAGCARESGQFESNQVVNLPNPIDTGIFKPFDKNLARELLNLPLNKKVILFGAVNATGDPRKGYQQLADALRYIQTGDIELAIFGASRPEQVEEFNFPVNYLGSMHDELSLSMIYNAADVLIVPSLQENLSNVIMESMACGTPVVAFNIGGNPDLIDHRENGYLAVPYDPVDLSRGIDWVLNQPDPQLLSGNARQKVMNCFEMTGVSRQYLEMYESIALSSSIKKN